MVKATNQSRALYNTLKAMKAKGEFAKDAIITESYLRLETILTGSANVIFNTLQNVGTQIATEKRLSTPDAFIVTDFGLALKKTSASISQGQAKLYTYPEPTVFTGGEASNLQNIYNGFMTVKIDQTTWIDSLDTMRFLRIGQAQQGLAQSANATANVYLNSQWDSSEWGYKALEPSIRLDGGSNNDISLTLPEALAMGGTSNTVNYAVLLIRGYLVQRGSRLYKPNKGMTARRR